MEAVNHWMSQSRSMSQKYEKQVLMSENSNHRYFQNPSLRVQRLLVIASLPYESSQTINMLQAWFDCPIDEQWQATRAVNGSAQGSEQRSKQSI